MAMSNPEKVDDTAKEFTPLEILALTAACRRDPEAEIACEQLANAVVTRREATGCGLFVYFATQSNRLLASADGRILWGSQRITLNHPQLAHGADVIVWVENGRMDCLELVTFGTEDFPDSGKFEIVYWPANDDE